METCTDWRRQEQEAGAPIKGATGGPTRNRAAGLQSSRAVFQKWLNFIFTLGARYFR